MISPSSKGSTVQHSRLDDFITLYNAFWYRDFPVTQGGKDIASRADWTTHIATSIRQVASFMGLYSCFESGGRTDAELQFNDRTVWAKLEWEWEEPRGDAVGELAKLASVATACEVCVFIGYSSVEHKGANLAKISAAWEGVHNPLAVFLVSFDAQGLRRRFQRLETFLFDGHGYQLLRDQPALPWECPKTRWEVS